MGGVFRKKVSELKNVAGSSGWPSFGRGMKKKRK